MIEEAARKADLWYNVRLQNINTERDLGTTYQLRCRIGQERTPVSTRYHEITLCAAEYINIEEMFRLCLNQGRF